MIKKAEKVKTRQKKEHVILINLGLSDQWYK